MVEIIKPDDPPKNPWRYEAPCGRCRQTVTLTRLDPDGRAFYYRCPLCGYAGTYTATEEPPNDLD